MAQFNFKSSGTTTEQRKSSDDASAPAPRPIGMKTPLELGSDGGILKMHTSAIDQVSDNLRNLIQTSWGERLGRYSIGANLRPLLSDWVSLDDFEAQAMQRISAAVQKWMPFVSLGEFTAALNDANTNAPTLDMSITYNVPALGEVNRTVRVSMRVM